MYHAPVVGIVHVQPQPQVGDVLPVQNHVGLQGDVDLFFPSDIMTEIDIASSLLASLLKPIVLATLLGGGDKESTSGKDLIGTKQTTDTLLHQRVAPNFYPKTVFPDPNQK